jgi:uncharacterized protein YhfF
MITPPPICEFAFPGPLRDRLVAAVLRGEKTATTSLLADWEADGAPVPKPGDRLSVVDSDGRPVATIQIVSVERIRLGAADLALARDEGEGFGSVAEWRADHERFWNEKVRPTLGPAGAAPLDDDTPIVVQRFRLVD